MGMEVDYMAAIEFKAFSCNYYYFLNFPVMECLPFR